MDESQELSCEVAQDRILESFDTELSLAEKDQLQQHCSRCEACASFMATQSDIDLRLWEQITAPELSPRFGGEIRAQVARRPHSSLPSWLPDAAYIAGSAVGLIVCAVTLPFPVQRIIVAGTLMTGLVYLLQTFVLGIGEDPTDS